MLRTISCISLCAPLLLCAPPADAGDRVTIKQQDGSRWRGEVNDRVEVTYKNRGKDVTLTGTLMEASDAYIKLKAQLAGRSDVRVIFMSDIVSIKDAMGDDTAASASNDNTSSDSPTASAADGDASDSRAKARRGADAYDDPTPGVFFLTMEGMVGVEFRAEEVRKLAEEADKYGPGQILVFEVRSGGGMVLEGQEFARLFPEIKKRHRCVAWIEEAISGGCAFAVLCDEIYFKTVGAAGSITMFRGADNTSAKGEELAEWQRTLGDWFEQGGRSRYIAEAMIHAPNELSYDKNEETGEVTFYRDLSGEYKLSTSEQNLTFNSSNAYHCGFADGIADTYEELAEHLDLPNGWHEKSDYGRKMQERWVKTVEQANREIPKLFAQYNYKGVSSGDQVVILGNRVRILEKLMKWVDRCERCAMMQGVPDKETLRREIESLRYQIAQIRRNRR